MNSYGHLSSAYTQLLSEIYKVGGVPCEELPALFYPEDIANPIVRRIATKKAREICSKCPITEKCFTYALETNQRHGIWGGTTPDER